MPKFFFSLSSQSIEAAILLNLSPEDKTRHHNSWLFQPSPASMLNNLIVPGSRSKILGRKKGAEVLVMPGPGSSLQHVDLARPSKVTT
jgi:hypothetical protein